MTYNSSLLGPPLCIENFFPRRKTVLQTGRLGQVSPVCGANLGAGFGHFILFTRRGVKAHSLALPTSPFLRASQERLCRRFFSISPPPNQSGVAADGLRSITNSRVSALISRQAGWV